MVWIGGDETPEEGVEERAGHIVGERDSPRPATIPRVATELEVRGGEIQELFKEIRCAWGKAVLPIPPLAGEHDYFFV